MLYESVIIPEDAFNCRQTLIDITAAEGCGDKKPIYG